MFRKKSIFISKQVYSYSIVFAMMVLIFFIAFYNYIIITSEKISTLSQQELADKTIKQVEYYLNDMDNIAYQVMTNSQLVSVFNRLQQDKTLENHFESNLLLDIDMRSILTTINGPHKLMWRISVYNQYYDYISSGAIADQESIQRFLMEQATEEEMTALKAKRDKPIILSPQPDRWSDNYSSKYVTIRRPLMNIYSQEVFGIVEIQQDIKTLVESIEFDVMESIDITIIDDDGRMVFDTSDQSEKRSSLNKVSKTSERYGWTVILSQSKYAMIAPYKLLIVTVLVGSIAITLLMILAIVIIAKNLSKPIILLKDTVSQLSIQNISEEYQSDNNIDEVRELNIAFSSMLNRLSESIALEKKAWLLALQAQMNPHFLYNSLSIISASAVEQGNDNVVMMCHELSSMLRYIASYKEITVTLKDEIQNVTSYLQLMKWRYEDYFIYEIEVQEEILAMPMPKLILQPLAENCFAHAFVSVEPPYFVKITAGIEENSWYIKVCDNGCGLKEEEIQQIIDKIEDYWKGSRDKYSQMKIGGLGLVNTLIRMKLNTGKEIMYSIENNKPQGLIITMRGDI
ncbi:sensor histidine kinase [Cellulosilyticum sp. I15G10I2]|uniref:sensor histidine kinase n=1 Tax=Cellulosilyticum sp. I15G10I2 TaxID=1892843 RepID=UPI00085C9356|nr:histidine kinase [Cellulosilyticum sp. I15G10I2]